MIKSSGTDLDAIIALVSAKKVAVPIDGVVNFDQVPEVLKKSSTWKSAGKIVIKVA